MNKKNIELKINNKIINFENEIEAIEIASIETFNGNKVKLNNKDFNIMDYAKNELKNKLALENY